MADTPAISCVIPVYNDKRRLPRAVDSVLRQGAQVQVVLVDDCSSDGSRELALDLARRDPRIVAFPLPENRGQGYARNIGAVLADAPYLTFLDQDDEHAPGWYEHALATLRSNPALAAIKGEIELVDLPPELTVTRSDPRWPALVYSPMWNVVMRKVVYHALGGCPTSSAYRTREGAEDITLITALSRSFRLGRSAQLATRHYVNPDGATAYYLKRTRVVGTRIEFVEFSQAEQTGALDRAHLEFQSLAAERVAALRAAMQPAPAEASGNWLARALRRLAGRR